MFVGHLGLAYFGKAARREVPLLLLVASAYAPDIVRFVLSAVPVESELPSHSIPAVLVFAVVIAASWLFAGGAAGGAIAVAIVCMLHWPADVLTGCKPTTPSGPWLGFIAYRRPLVDLAAELSLLWAGWLALRRSGRAPSQLAHRWWVPAIACVLQLAFLASLYAGAEFLIGKREWTWHPTEGILVFKRVPTETLPCRPPQRTEP